MSATSTTSTSPITPRAAEQYWRATVARDARADGTFILGVRSTHLYCRPSCPARRPLRRNVVFFRTGDEAEKLGFRPCLRCKPNEKSGSLALVERAASELARNTEENLRTPKAQAKKKARTAKIKTNDPLENRPNPLPGGVPRPDPIPLCKKPPCAVKEGPEMKPGLTLPAGNAQTRSKESR